MHEWCVTGAMSLSCGPLSHTSSHPQWCCGFVVSSVKCRSQFCVFVGAWGKGVFGSPQLSPASPGSPHPSQRPSWLEQEVLGFGVRGEEAETSTSQNQPDLSWPCQPGGTGFPGLIAELHGGGSGGW